MMFELARSIAITAADVVGHRCALAGLAPKDTDFIAYVAAERGFREPKVAAAIVALAREELKRRNKASAAALRRPRRSRKSKAPQTPDIYQGSLSLEAAA